MKYASINPATHKLSKEFTFDSEEEIVKKIERAHASFGEWRKLSVAERVTRFNKVADVIDTKIEELARVTTEEMGKPMEQGLGEAKATAEMIRYFGGIAEENLKPRVIDMGYKKAMSVYQPLGVIYSVQPWNFPIALPFMTNAQAFLAGNTILMKPPPSCPRVGQLWSDIMNEAGFTKGEFDIVWADTKDTDLIMGHKDVRGCNFTGSTAAGKIVAAICGKHMKKASFELGGSDPFIVLDDADLDKAAKVGALARLLNTGQCCIAAKRFIVMKSVYEAYKEKLIKEIETFKLGDPTAMDTKLGPLARQDLFEGLKKQVRDTLEGGATVGYGNADQLKEGVAEGAGNFLAPMIIENIKKGNPGYSTEFFGPIFQMYCVESEEEAVALANDVEYGLGGHVFSGDEARGEKVALEIDTGTMFINGFFFPTKELPFGGTKCSGYGREMGPEAFTEFTNAKTVAIPQ